jgi:CheY-like chemotaxis protein
MKRILLVAHDASLRESRASVLRGAGYVVVAVITVEEAVTELRVADFDVVLIGRNPSAGGPLIDRALRTAFLDQPILKIANAADDERYASRIVGASPHHILAALTDMLFKDSA